MKNAQESAGLKKEDKVSKKKSTTKIKPKSKQLKPVSKSNDTIAVYGGEKIVVHASDNTEATVSKALIMPSEEHNVNVSNDLSPDEIWNKIKGRELGLFGLNGQTIEKYCTPINLDPSRCLLKYNVSSVIPALESVVHDFAFEVVGSYLMISNKTTDEKK